MPTVCLMGQGIHLKGHQGRTNNGSHSKGRRSCILACLPMARVIHSHSTHTQCLCTAYHGHNHIHRACRHLQVNRKMLHSRVAQGLHHTSRRINQGHHGHTQPT